VVVWTEFGKFFGIDFWGGQVQRRGADVNTPKIGSRVGEVCFGGIWGVHAVLRRELGWGNLDLAFFGVLLVGPRGPTEEGGHYVCISVQLGELGVGFIGCTPLCKWGDLFRLRTCKGELLPYGLTHRGELFGL
jgi:hypothetical protein